jgi:glyoxylase I family protein
MPAAVAGYSHVAICVSDVEQSRTFYSKQLGLPEAERPDFGFPGIWYDIGVLQLHLMEREVPDSSGKGIGPHIALHVPTDGFLDFVEQLRGDDVPIMVEPNQREFDGVWAAFCKDPDGNIIELTDMGPKA